MVVNWANGIEAMWYDKSHLNRYLLDHKPTKVLSLEDLQDPQLLGWPWRTCVQLLGWPRVMKKLRFGPCLRITRTPGTHEGLSPSPAGGADFSGAIRAGSYFCPLEGHCGACTGMSSTPAAPAHRRPAWGYNVLSLCSLHFLHFWVICSCERLQFYVRCFSVSMLSNHF
ncbi:hypothetical protein GH733_018892 [Mirounga leonina]|nr:hypothetical protein GH733_018892 [Mirounga leonina]